jgi:hypothetical protein
VNLPRLSIFLALGAAALLLARPGHSQQQRKEVIKNTMPAVVMVVAVDVDNGRLKPVSSGSGTIISNDGSILTNHHVLSDKKAGKLHDLFLIGRFQRADREPQFVCAGKPTRGVLKPKLDLALLKCDLDMNGRPWKPSGWPSIPVGRSEDVVPGQQVWVLGYPNVGGSTIHVTRGLVSGWTGEQGGANSRAYMKTDAAITHGNSGGTAVDDEGKFIGVPTAFRVTTEMTGGSVATVGKVGLIRPVEHARDLVTLASTGWTPAEGAKAPPTISAGVTVRGKIIDASSGQPVLAAVVVVFKAGIKVADINQKELEKQALSWGQSNAAGEFALQAPVPRGGKYSVAIIARGYRARALDEALAVPDNAPQIFEPWPTIRLERL